jgi:steroid delta-isomerase-like uncharacterized protein
MTTVLPTTETLLNQYSDAWHAHDVDRIMAFHTVDTVFQLHNGAPEAVGADAVREAFRFILDIYPDLSATKVRVEIGDAHAVIESVMRATNATTVIEVDAVDVFRFENGHIARKDTYLNTAGL